MRNVTNAERILMRAPQVNHYVRVEIQNADRTWKDMTGLGGVDWIESVEWGEDIDAPIGTFSIALRRDVDDEMTESLAPTWGGSPLNRNDAGGYAPLCHPGRNVRISTKVVAFGVDPAGTSWKEMFIGRIDDVQWSSTPIVVSGRDLGGWLVDHFTSSVLPYIPAGSGPEAIEAVIQDLLDYFFEFGAPGLGPVTLYTPVSPGFAINNTEGKPIDIKGLMEIFQDYALLIGWVCRFRYDASECVAPHAVQSGSRTHRRRQRVRAR